MLELYHASRHNNGDGKSVDEQSHYDASHAPSGMSQHPTGNWNMHHMGTNMSAYSMDPGLDPDDPQVTGIHKKNLDDPEDIEENCKEGIDLKLMDYRQRRKEALKIKIKFNVTCELWFFLALGSCLTLFI